MGCGCGASSGGNCKGRNRQLTTNRNRLQTLLKSVTSPDLRLEYSQKITDMNATIQGDNCAQKVIVDYFTKYVNNEYSKHSK